jgi:hypothetical protein
MIDIEFFRADGSPQNNNLTINTGGTDNEIIRRDGTGTTLQGSSVNVPDGLTGDVVTTTGSQTLTNKSIAASQITGILDRARMPASPGITDFRCSLSSSDPVASIPSGGGGNLYLHRYNGKYVTLWNSTDSRWDEFELPVSPVSLSLSGLNTTQPYDVYLYNNAGTLTLESLAWTNNTGRATGLEKADGVWVKDGASADNTRLWVATVKMQNTSQCEDTEIHRLLFNAYNRIQRDFWIFDTQDSYSYTTATWRASRAQNSLRVDFVIGISDEPVYAEHQFVTTGATGYGGICLDNTTQNDARLKAWSASSAWASSIYNQPIAIGYHFLQMVEKGAASVTFYGDVGTPADTQAGLLGHLYA